MEEQDLVLFEKKGHIAIFTLNRPKAMNAVSAELSERFEALMEEFEKDENLWIGIVTSSHPKTFCAGADLKSVSAGKNIMTSKGGFAGFVHFPRTKPMIAAVDGYALAGGCEIVLTCDMVVASKKAKFGVPEVKRSLVPAAGGMFRLPRKLPEHIANELLLTGDPLPAQRMYDLGFVNVLCEDGKVMEEAMKLAKRVETNAPLAVFEARRVAMKTLGVTEEEAWDVSSESMPYLARTEDFREGPRAFIEKRAPGRA
mmetsp:Transcript_11845/g.13720  ORF Transcript_11845/g.13720 Transcript_11845/m.13720 type:complete len:256 (-) Transcript_11845:26-793(-)